MRIERRLAAGVAGLVLICLSCGGGGNGGPTVPDETPLRAPSELQVTGTAPTEIAITWRDNTPDEVGFRIERSQGGPGSFAQRDTVTHNVTLYTDKQVLEGQTYYYRVRAYARSGASDPSAAVWAIATTNATPSVPVERAPRNGQRDIEAGPITLTWSSHDTDAGDQVLYDVHFGQVRNELALVASAIPDTFLAISEPLVLNSHYFWHVVARDSRGAMGVGPIWGFNTRVILIQIPSGYVVMGDQVEYPHPGNPVWVDQFEIAKFEVTNQQYADFLNEALRTKPAPIIRTTGGAVYDPGGAILYARTVESEESSQISYDRQDSLFTTIPGKESFPVVDVTWFGADAYARFFGRRLPTEAEWEMAARGNSTENGDSLFALTDTTSVTVGFGRTYPWGQEPDASRSNFRGSGDPFEASPRTPTTPVGFYDGGVHGGFQTQDGSTALAVHDMAGNVWEWCDDWFGPYTKPHNPPTTGLLKVLRGGGWNKGSGSMQTWRRSIVDPSKADAAVGFRTVRRVTP